MPTHHMTSREFNHDIAKAKRDALDGPVIITDRGKPAHVLISYDDFQQLQPKQTTLIEALHMECLSEISFDPPKLFVGLKPASFD